MTDTKHTPGPWTWECESGEWPDHALIGRDGDSVMSWDFDLGFSFGEAADQHLIAAAPDMLEALERIEKWFDTDVEILDAMSPDERADHERQHQMIRDSIAKARGDES